MISISEHFTYRKLLLFSFPSVVSMIFTSLYTIIDGIFVANYAGSLPFAAINLIWPPLGIIQALGFMIGAGGSALVSRLLGQHEHEKAKRVFTMLIAFSAVLGVVCNGLFLFFVEPIARFLGADATLLPDCIIYGRVLAWFMGFCMVSSTFQAFLITVSKARLALIFNLICGGLNILLDQLLVGNLHLGVYGAGYATGLNWLLAALLPIAFFIKNPTLSYTRFHWDFRALFETCSNGISEMISNVSISLIAALYNYALISWIGSDGVIAFGIIQYIGFVFAALFLGYGSALIPVIGYHFGDGNDRELLGILKRSLILITGFSVLLFGISELSADFLAAVFVHDEPELFEISVHAIRIYSISFLLLGFNIFSSSFFTGLNNGLVSGILSFCRTFLFQVGAIFILPQLFGVDGIWNAVNVSELLTFFIAIFFLLRFVKKADAFKSRPDKVSA